VTRYRAIVDDVDEELLARTRRVPGLRDLRVERTASGVQLEIEMDHLDGGLGALMRAVSWNGTALRDFRPIEAEPVDVFKRVTHGSGD
ncbi:MAG: hypothetical protein QOI11_3322, partial [Candidatus Eremiobacteraeota bacterium]|jgi:hypothetical protein|nr:hypothetical protein [Candidatus Eremiobacteraeota bacterium]